MFSATWATSSSSKQYLISGLIASRTLVSGPLPSATPRIAMSRSVIMPTSLSFSVTGSNPAMKTLGSILVLTAALTAMPALADSVSTTDKPIVLAGGRFCVGPACVGRDRDRDWRYRHRGYGYDRDSGCRDVTVRRDDGSVTHIRRCD